MLPALFLSMLVLGGSANPLGVCDHPEDLFRHWTHLHEADKEGVMVFKPSDYNFPRARGRTGFEIRENGEFIQYDIGPDDRSAKSKGRWQATGKDQISVTLEDRQIGPYELEIVSCTNSLLKVRKIALKVPKPEK